MLRDEVLRACETDYTLPNGRIEKSCTGAIEEGTQ